MPDVQQIVLELGDIIKNHFAELKTGLSIDAQTHLQLSAEERAALSGLVKADQKWMDAVSGYLANFYDDPEKISGEIDRVFWNAEQPAVFGKKIVADKLEMRIANVHTYLTELTSRGFPPDKFKDASPLSVVAVLLTRDSRVFTLRNRVYDRTIFNAAGSWTSANLFDAAAKLYLDKLGIETQTNDFTWIGEMSGSYMKRFPHELIRYETKMSNEEVKDAWSRAKLRDEQHGLVFEKRHGFPYNSIQFAKYDDSLIMPDNPPNTWLAHGIATVLADVAQARGLVVARHIIEKYYPGMYAINAF